MRWLLVLVALVAGSSFASDPESKPLVGPWLVELAVAPVSAQVNGLFVEHLGTAGQVAVVIAPYFRVFVSGTWNWQAGESRLARELFRTGRVSPNRIDQNDSSGLFISMGLVGGNVGDMRAIDNELRRGRPVTEAQLTPVCRVNAFDGTDPDTGLKRSNDVPLSLGLLRNPSVEWASLQALQVSFGVVF